MQFMSTKLQQLLTAMASAKHTRKQYQLWCFAKIPTLNNGQPYQPFGGEKDG